MSNIGRRYKLGEGGHTLTEVGIAQPGTGEIKKIKFGMPVKITHDEPVWVALGKRILELEREVQALMVELNRSRK